MCMRVAIVKLYTGVTRVVRVPVYDRVFTSVCMLIQLYIVHVYGYIGPSKALYHEFTVAIYGSKFS